MRLRLSSRLVTTGALLVSAALGLSACASAVVAPISSGAASAPMAVAGYDWFFHTDEGEARLAYGLAESDDVPLAMTCRDGSGQIHLNATAPTGSPREVRIEAGGQAGRFAAQSEPSEIHDGVFLTAQADANAPVFQGFRRTGWLTVVSAGQRRALAPQPGSAGKIDQFFEMCG